VRDAVPAVRAIRTIGHGTLPAEDFVRLVSAGGIGTVVDVRRFPGSRRHPHFGSDEMARWLAAAGLAYRWLPSLGGRRKPVPGSPNVGLRVPQFRAYADHMGTEEFAAGVADLLAIADAVPVAVMCAESVWWRCHRRLLADHLVLVETREVEHLFHDGRLDPHAPTAEARRAGSSVVYDVGTQQSLLHE
jgi:uncharacterized protein (DUF488 family)